MAILQEIKVPLISVNDTSLTVVEVKFSNGDLVKKDVVILVFETSKTTYDVAAEAEGYIQYLCETGYDYVINETVAKIFSERSEAEKPTSVRLDSTIPVIAAQQTIIAAEAIWKGNTIFSPGAIILMESKGINHSRFAGKDFVSKYDVEDLPEFNGKIITKAAKAGHSVFDRKKDLPIDETKVTVEKLTSNKKREIGYLHEVQSTGLTSTINTFVETGGIFVHINESLQFLKESLLPVIIYETGRLLLKYPRLNAWFTGDGTAFYKDVNVGFAIDMDNGLKVLKVAGAPQKTLREIENVIIDLSGKYLEGTLDTADLSDITFVITDLSSEDVAFFTPLINMMNSAILGISSIDRILNRCILSVTFDHRITEGKYVAQFLRDLKHRLESYQSKFHPNLNKDIACFRCHKSLIEDLSDVGFAKCITPQGNEGFVCQSCLKGF